ncbi:receptor-type guanylate cyclase Gyc76C, partial [Nephila pilipes]
TSLKSTISIESKVTGQAFTHIASYKGTLVATKTLTFKSRNIDIPRETKKEMKMMRELHHDNINPFIGACLQPHYILLVTEYCAKGSLKDILENPDIKLDHMFIASLVFDLIKGMIFLHDSDLKVHGNLKSSNCVVTSRWVLQITDYGLRELCTAAENEIFLNYEHYK